MNNNQYSLDIFYSKYVTFLTHNKCINKGLEYYWRDSTEFY